MKDKDLKLIQRTIEQLDETRRLLVLSCLAVDDEKYKYDIKEVAER